MSAVTLYMSRLRLDPRHARTRSELRRPYELHRTLAAAFADLPSSRVLFRAEAMPEPHVLVQSRQPGEWERLALPHVLSVDQRVQTLDGVRTGDPLTFRLLCRPTKRTQAEGRRVVLQSPEDLFAWLRRQGEWGGFGVSEVAFERVYWLDSRDKVRGQAHGVDRNRTPGARRLGGPDEPLLGAVRFEGSLLVTDADRLRETVAAGIGAQKAFGFGLLSLARPR